MNIYLTPSAITESLGLTHARKSMSMAGETYYLLNEFDLLPYGIARAIEEGSIVFQNSQRTPDATEQGTEATVSDTTDETTDGEDPDETSEDTSEVIKEVINETTEEE